MRAIAVAVVAVVLSACSSSGPSPTAAVASSATPTATSAASSPPPPAPSASPSASVALPTITDPSRLFKPLATGWRPTGTTLVVARAMVSGDITLVAVTIGSRGAVGAPTPIVSFTPDAWSLRPDGGALALSAWTGRSGRIAVWDVPSGAARWLTADEGGAISGGPMWSRDGGSIYYVSEAADGKRGLFQIDADGSAKKQVPGSEDFAGSIQGWTPDGRGVVWSRGQAGGSVEVLDIATGVSRHLENNARAQSWRVQQPRALLEVGGCCAGRPGGELVAFDDVALTSRVVAARGPAGDPAWGVAAWDPAGTRVAAVRFDSTSPYEGTLTIVDPQSGAVQAVPDTRGAANVRWLAEGIVFTRPLRIGVEVVLLPGGAGPAVSVYQDSALIQRIEVPR